MSSADLLSAARAEVAKLSAELEASPLYQKLQAARRVVELYRPQVTAQRDPIAEGFQRIRETMRQDTKMTRIEHAAVEYLKLKGSRASSAEILQAITEAGVEVGGADPVKAISAYLSNAKGLNNVRAFGGYGLVEWGSNPGP